MRSVEIYINLPGAEDADDPIREFEAVDIQSYPCPFSPDDSGASPTEDDLVWLENVKQFIWSLGL